MPHSQPGVTTNLLARKQQSMKKVESWDDDFGDLEDDFLPRESVLHASVSSAGSFVRPKTDALDSDDDNDDDDQFGNAFAQQKAQGAKFLTAFREDSADLGFTDERNLTTKMSSFNLQRNMRKSIDYGDGDDEAEYSTIRKRPSTLRVRSATGSPVKYGTVKRSQQEIREAFKNFDLDDDEEDDDDTQEVKTLRASKPSKATVMTVSHGAMFNPPPQSKSRSKSPAKAPTKPSNRRLIIKEPEDFEDGFDIDAPGDLASRLQKVKHQLHVDQEEDFDSWGEESSRATSRMSETSVSSVMSSSYEESEADDGEAFLDGLELPEKHVNFQEILETRQRDAQYVADHEDELLMQGRKYDTIRSNGSGNSLKTLEMLNGNEDEMDLDFFDGIDVKDEVFAHQKEKTVHKNIVVKGKKRNTSLSSDSKKKSMLKMKQSMPQLRDDKRDTSPTKRSTTKLARIGENSLGEVSPTKKRIPSAQLRSVQSMSNFSAQRTPSARPKYTRGRATKVFGDGTELDRLGDLPTNMDTEHSLTVTPKASRVRTIKHKPLDTYREKPSKAESSKKSVKSSLSSKKSSANLTKKRSSKESKKKGPGLIQQLGPPKTSIISKGHNGDMRFNPRKLIWEGNDIELKKFESVNPKGPGLIAFISNKGVQVVGDMVFDPDKMCWIRVGNSDEADIFEGMEDLDVSVRSRGGESVLRPSASMHTSIHGEFQVGKEFDITNDMLKRMQYEDERWQRKCGHWFSPDETFDREYLNEIRQMVMK